MNPIGGYFELADNFEGGVFPHRNGILLNTGRNALEFILRSIGNVSRVYLPYYTCELVLEPLKRLSIPWSFYSIGFDFEMTERIDLRDNEYLVVNNYFGLKDDYIRTLASVYGECLIVDCAQAFFAKPIPGIKSFYSCRKFVGVADGGVAYTESQLKDIDFPEDNTSDHDSHLYTRKAVGAEAGFKEYQENEKKLDNQPILSMSGKTTEILNHIDYAGVVARRRENWAFLHSRLKGLNRLSLPETDSFACPMVYPFMVQDGDALRKRLIKEKIFVAKYWPNVAEDGVHKTEFLLSNLLIPLPCDQRYKEEDLQRLVELLGAA